MEGREKKSVSEQFWQAHRERAWELGKAVREEGGSQLEEYASIAGYFRELSQQGGDIACGAALWESQQYGGMQRCCRKGEGDTRDLLQYASWEIGALRRAVQSTDPWIRSYAYNALYNALRDRNDAPLIRECLAEWKARYPDEAARHEREWKRAEEIASLRPLTWKELQQLDEALEMWVAHHPEPDEVFAYMGREALSPRSMREHIRNRTETGMELLRMIAHGRTDKSWTEICRGFSTAGTTQKKGASLE